MRLFECSTMLNGSLYHIQFVFAKNRKQAKELFVRDYNAHPYRFRPGSSAAKMTDIQVHERKGPMVFDGPGAKVYK